MYNFFSTNNRRSTKEILLAIIIHNQLFKKLKNDHWTENAQLFFLLFNHHNNTMNDDLFTDNIFVFSLIPLRKSTGDKDNDA